MPVTDAPETGSHEGESGSWVAAARKVSQDELRFLAEGAYRQLNEAHQAMKDLPETADIYDIEKTKAEFKKAKGRLYKVQCRIEAVGRRAGEAAPGIGNYKQALDRAEKALELKGMPTGAEMYATLEVGAWWDLAEALEFDGKFDTDALQHDGTLFSFDPENPRWKLSAHNSLPFSERDRLTVQVVAGRTLFHEEFFVLPGLIPDGPERAKEFEMYSHLRRLGVSIEEAITTVIDSGKLGKETNARGDKPRQAAGLKEPVQQPDSQTIKF